MALGVMNDIGPGGHYLAHDHTYRRFRNEIWRPKLLNRQNWQNWELAGSRTYQERVRERVIKLLETESEPLLDETTFKELRRICELADARHI
jgi:trimethylamine--corrinoid protein Co-methyltransferase